MKPERLHTSSTQSMGEVLSPILNYLGQALYGFCSGGKEEGKRKQEIGQKERNWLMGERSGIGSCRGQTNAMLIEVFSNGFLRRKKNNRGTGHILSTSSAINIQSPEKNVTGVES